MLKKNFERAKDFNIARVLLFYSGHGDPKTGNWVTYSGEGLDEKYYRLSITEILDLIVKTGYDKEVEFTTDACYSGKQCFEAKKWWEKNKGKLKMLVVNTTSYRYKKS